jgi:hypothetical protein
MAHTWAQRNPPEIKPKEKVMKKYVTFVKDAEESRKVQEALFSAGFKWRGIEGATIAHTDKSFIHINYDRAAKITWEHTIVKALEGARQTPINAKDIIYDPFQLDGAKQPEEMIDIDGKAWSKSTIKAALKQYAE